MSIIDLADTAIKIGLGALIAGVFTVLTSNKKHQQELDVDRRKRREKLIEKIVDEFECTYQSLSQKYEVVLSLSKIVTGEKYRINAHKTIHSTNDLPLFHVVESRLLLLGLKEEAKLVLKFRGKIGEYEGIALPKDKSHPNPQILNHKLEQIFKDRYEIYEELSKYYDDPGKSGNNP